MIAVFGELGRFFELVLSESSRYSRNSLDFPNVKRSWVTLKNAKLVAAKVT